MDHIKKAIERAKAERGEQRLRQPTPGRHVPPRQTTNIGYQNTRVVQVSTDDLRERRVIAGLDDGPERSAYRILRTQVLQHMNTQRWTTLAVTSCGESEGKTLTAVNLAVSLARELSRTVLLVDLDCRRPSVHRYFGYTSVHGLSDHLLMGRPLAEVLFNPGIERLVVLPFGPPLPNASEMLRSPQALELLRELKSRFADRLVLLDLPPLLLGDDALALTPYVDCALLVIEDGKTRPRDVLQAVALLQHTNLLGTVLNKSDHAGGHYHYY